ncbi:MAG: glycosyl transferase [Acholeplasmataceae bacterium]|nr:glycosyl transferase [Acholeplasmataceae bacterium]
MKYGQFDNNKREYVIKNPKTPTPWINYLGNQGFYGLISQTGGGYTFYKDAKLRRLTRYRYNQVPIDQNGRIYYISDGSQVWNPGFLPVKTPLDAYQCRHGMGYTIIESKKNGISSQLKFFIPLEDQVEVHVLTLKNETNKDKEVYLHSLLEWNLWNAVDDQTNFQRNLNIGEVEVENQTIFHLTEYRERRNHYAFFHTNKKIQGFDTDRLSFLGEYNGWNEPDTVLNHTSHQSIASGGAPIASHFLKINLRPQQEETIIFLLGYIENEKNQKYIKDLDVNKSKAYHLIDKYDTIEKVNQAFNQLSDHWTNILGNYQIKSSDDKLNTMVNTWHQYQCMVTFNLSRSASYYESGTGRGIGFRDSCQDILGFVHMVPEKSRERIIDLASIQFKDGSTYHQFQPLTKLGNADIGSGFNDDPLWLIAATSAYIRETGDFSILDELVPYNNQKGTEERLFEHLKASIHFTINNLGPHGLPLIGRADWNDCLNLNCFSEEPGESFQTTDNKTFGAAESVFIAGMFVKYGSEYVDICKRINEKSEVKLVTEEIDKMKDNTIKNGWDGQWFLRAYDAYGNKVGSHENNEGKIYIEPQGFCVLAGIGDDAIKNSALKSTSKYLRNEYGLELLYPPYASYHIELGEISSYPPGYKENGSVFNHNNPWIVVAHAELNQAEEAFDIYKLNAPAYIEDISDIHKTEPYVYSQTIAGRSAKTYGEAKNSWLTGTASWAFVAISQYILGIKPHLDGLEISPVVPKSLKDINITRVFREKTFHITIKHDDNHKHEMIVNGNVHLEKVIQIDEHVDTYNVICYV